MQHAAQLPPNINPNPSTSYCSISTYANDLLVQISFNNGFYPPQHGCNRSAAATICNSCKANYSQGLKAAGEASYK
jgi:hypothetical protein